MRRRVALLFAGIVVVGVTTAPAALATHSCAPVINDVCRLTCVPIPIWC